MKLSISNIAWDQVQDTAVYTHMIEKGYTGLEIAPTKVFGADAYGKADEVKAWKRDLSAKYGFEISSMQSICYGRKESIFGLPEERASLLAHVKKAIDTAQILNCRNLVFGCPKNRIIPEGGDPKDAFGFFKEAGDYAFEHGTVLALEANPVIYGTNFINTTEEAIRYIEEVGSKGFLLNLDAGTMIENKEDISVLEGKADLINHVHISEPYLAKIEKRGLHLDIAAFLAGNGYDGYVSIETKTVDDISVMFCMMDYVREVFS